MTASKPRLAFDLKRDVEVLAAMVANLTPYLYENEIYAALTGDMPRLTLGGLLLRLHRLTVIEDVLSPAQRQTVQDARRKFEAEAAQWAVQYEKKLQAELASRLASLDQFLGECSESRAGCIANYPVQAEKRTMIEHLKTEADKNGVLSSEMAAHTRTTDQHIRHCVQADEFIYTDARLQPAYPPAQYWWLYSHISEGNGH